MTADANRALWVDTFAQRHSLSPRAQRELCEFICRGARGDNRQQLALAALWELTQRALREREPGDSADTLLIAPSEILACLDQLDLQPGAAEVQRG